MLTHPSYKIKIVTSQEKITIKQLEKAMENAITP